MWRKDRNQNCSSTIKQCLLVQMLCFYKCKLFNCYKKLKSFLLIKYYIYLFQNSFYNNKTKQTWAKLSKVKVTYVIILRAGFFEGGAWGVAVCVYRDP